MVCLGKAQYPHLGPFDTYDRFHGFVADRYFPAKYQGRLCDPLRIQGHPLHFDMGLYTIEALVREIYNDQQSIINNL